MLDAEKSIRRLSQRPPHGLREKDSTSREEPNPDKNILGLDFLSDSEFVTVYIVCDNWIPIFWQTIESIKLYGEPLNQAE